jgi:hypothetical protein
VLFFSADTTKDTNGQKDTRSAAIMAQPDVFFIYHFVER